MPLVMAVAGIEAQQKYGPLMRVCVCVCVLLVLRTSVVACLLPACWWIKHIKDCPH